MNSIPEPVLQAIAGFHSPIKLQEIIQLISSPEPQALFIKNRNLQYVYANAFFTQIMGLKRGQEITGMEDIMLCADKTLIERYQAYDMAVLETGTPLSLSDFVQPKYNTPYSNIMEGMEYPLFRKSGKPEYVLGIVKPIQKQIKLDWNTIFNVDQEHLNQLISRKFYLLNRIRFSRREIQILIALMKGQHAGETAATLAIKQCTVESYLVNIKNKIGVNTKSELIHFLIDHRLLEQIIL